MKKKWPALSSAAGKIRKGFTVWFIVIIACSVGFHAGVQLVLADMGLLGEVDSVAKAAPMLLTSLVILPFGAGVGILLLRYPMRPIKQLIQAMNRLAQGHFEERLAFPQKGPMQELANTFNTLACELENTEMLRADFVNNFSHEFKTPIVSIHGFASLLQKEKLTPAQREWVNVIADESMRLANMATNVLNLTKVENQQILTNLQYFNLSEQLRKCILLLEKKWSEKGLFFDTQMDEFFLSGDPELLQQVWVNLLDNAIKFSPVGGQIALEMEQEPENIRVLLRNHGPEIPPEDQKRLFDKFWQGDSSHAAQGTGIGLALVKTIVELHKGQVTVQSGPDETVFVVTLPRQA